MNTDSKKEDKLQEILKEFIHVVKTRGYAPGFEDLGPLVIKAEEAISQELPPRCDWLPTKLYHLQGLNTQEMIKNILNFYSNPWLALCEIHPNFKSPTYPASKKPKVAVSCNNGWEGKAWLRYSQGPRQGYFWDVYPEDMQSIERAIFSLSQAPCPPMPGADMWKFMPEYGHRDYNDLQRMQG